VATGATGRPLDLPYRADHLEVIKLKLAGEHFPLSISLRERVVASYRSSTAPVDGEVLPTEQLLQALSGCDQPELPLGDAIDRHLESTGVDARPTGEARALLAWTDQAYQDWTSRYPLAQTLADALHGFRPLAAGLALVDDNFTQPGTHPLHKLLDLVVESAVGWEPEVVRSDTLKNHILQARDAALNWFDDRDTDLSGVCEAFTRDSERARTRARRMAQRCVETELGRARTERARKVAARMINDGLARLPIPQAVGDFIKGPWYASAQLVLLKFGEDSRQWKAMSTVTSDLLDSLQPIDAAAPEKKQQLFELVTSLPKEIKRWLLSLHHDNEAVEEAVGLIEFSHLKVLRQQDLDSETVWPIDMGGSGPTPTEQAEKLRSLKPGQWFLIRQDEAPPRRLRLSLNLDRQQQLLFTDYSGLKALQLDYTDFESLLLQRLVKKIPHEASFSVCLARAAGIDSVEALQQALANADQESDHAPEFPMGAWLGFHDGETPLLAKVAVHDPQRDVYIFVNREGIKLRELARSELASLREQGLVEVLESKSTFRDQVSEARRQVPDPGPED
jgi:hypothetical protein